MTTHQHLVPMSRSNAAMGLLSFMLDSVQSYNCTLNMRYVYLPRANSPVTYRSGVQLNFAKASTNLQFWHSIQANHEMTYSNEPLMPCPELYQFY